MLVEEETNCWERLQDFQLDVQDFICADLGARQVDLRIVYYKMEPKVYAIDVATVNWLGNVKMNELSPWNV